MGIRSDKDILLLRVGLGLGATAVEEARGLDTGERAPEHSSYVFADIRGGVLATTSYQAPGAVLQEATEYDAWGKPVALPGRKAPVHGFADAEADEGTGYLHFGRRTYDPRLRRWLSPDPLV